MILDDLKQWVINDGVTDGHDCFKGSLPDAHTPNATALFEPPGRTPTYVMERPQPAYEMPHVQVMTRNQDYVVGRNVIQRYWQSLTKIANLSITYQGVATQYLRFTALQSP